MKIAQNLFDALKSLHELKIVHLDIKSDNILVGIATFDVKIIDFNKA